MDPQSLLLRTLSEHESSLGPNDVCWAFTNPKTAGPVSEWVERHLRNETLLTVEEAELYAHLQASGTLKRLLQSHDAHLPPRTAASLAAETASLESETEELKRQTVALRAQKASVEAVRSRQRAEAERKKKLQAQRRKKYAADREEVAAAVEDLLVVMREEVADLRATVRENEEVREEGTRMLESDDRVLTRLEGLAKVIVVPDDGGANEGTEVVKKVEELVQRLGDLSTQLMHTRLDRIFLEAFKRPGSQSPETIEGHPADGAPAENGTAGAPSAKSEIAEIQAEIDSLYPEIPGVVSMVLASRYLRPLHSTLSASRRKRGENWEVGGDYIRDVLAHLRNRTNATTELLQTALSRDHTILSIIATIEREASLPTQESEVEQSSTPPLAPTDAAAPRGGPSPTKGGLGRVPFLTPARRRSTIPGFNAEEFPELAILSHLGVPLSSFMPQTPSGYSTPASRYAPATPTPAAPARPPIPDSFLQQQIKARQNKLATQTAAVETAVKALVQETSGEAWAVNKTLREGVMAENLYPPTATEVEREQGAAALVAGEIRTGMGDVEKGVEEVAGKLERVVKKVDELERAGGDVGGMGVKKTFVERWGR